MSLGKVLKKVLRVLIKQKVKLPHNKILNKEQRLYINNLTNTGWESSRSSTYKYTECRRFYIQSP